MSPETYIFFFKEKTHPFVNRGIEQSQAFLGLQRKLLWKQPIPLFWLSVPELRSPIINIFIVPRWWILGGLFSVKKSLLSEIYLSPRGDKYWVGSSFLTWNLPRGDKYWVGSSFLTWETPSDRNMGGYFLPHLRSPICQKYIYHPRVINIGRGVPSWVEKLHLSEIYLPKSATSVPAVSHVTIHYHSGRRYICHPGVINIGWLVPSSLEKPYPSRILWRKKCLPLL